MLRDIIEGALTAQPDLELVDTGDGVRLAPVVRPGAADVAIVANRDDAAPPAQLLVENPHLKLFVIGDDGRRADLLTLQLTTLGELSLQGLIDAIRAAAADGLGGG